ncbi:ABC transporter substrate-binding protein [Parasphingorhabdus pacifica]
MKKSLKTCGGLALTACLALSGCAGAGELSSSAAKTVTIAMVSNPQMEDAIKLAPRFEAEHPGIDLKFVSLSENEARAKITASTATQSDQFDVVMISNYETARWAKNGWLRNLSPHAANTPGYDTQDFFPSLREALSYQGDMYSMPFYGESSFLMYRKDLFEQAGITVPENPTWQQVASYAKQLHSPGKHAGICLRGKPGWGEQLAPLNTVINSFGGRWFDQDWNARINSPEAARAVGFYTDLVREYGQPSPATTGFSECATQFSQGKAAMWYDATSAVSTVENPDESRVAGKVGYVSAPSNKTTSDWLYTWSLGIPKTSDHPEAAWKFISWMTSKDYINLVGNELGWSRVPPGSRQSTYEIPEYRQVSAAYAPQTLRALRRADPQDSTVRPVPYTGAQVIRIPEWQDLGTRASQQISAVMAGKQSVSEALEQTQKYAEAVGKTYQEQR